MYPRDPFDSPDPSNISGLSVGSLELVDVHTSDGSRTANGDSIMMDGVQDNDQEMDISSPLGTDVIEAVDREDPNMQGRRMARAVAEKRSRRAKEAEEELARVEEAKRQLAATTRKEEMLNVRAACLPGVVFMAHEVMDCCCSRCKSAVRMGACFFFSNILILCSIPSHFGGTTPWRGC